jgi:hypothetical protein
MASIRTAGPAKDFGELQIVNEIDLDLPAGGGTGSSVRTARAKDTVWVADPRRPPEVYTILDDAPADAGNPPDAGGCCSSDATSACCTPA